MKALHKLDSGGFKLCYKCGKTKPITEFHKDKSKQDGLNYLCKECTKEYFQLPKVQERIKKYRQTYHQNNKEKIAKRSKTWHNNNQEWRKQYSKTRYMSQKQLINSVKRYCLICGFRDKPSLVFHHRDPKEKSFTIGTTLSTKLERLQKEIAKCVVLCANCHHKFHHYNLHPSEMSEYLRKKYVKLGLKISLEETYRRDKQ